MPASPKPKKAIAIIPKKPTPLFLRPIKLEYSKFFLAIFKGIQSAPTLDWTKITEAILEGASALDLNTGPEERAYTLLERAIRSAIIGVIGESTLRTLDPKNKQSETLKNLIDELGGCDITIDKTFFDSPLTLSILPIFQRALSEFLFNQGASTQAAGNIAKRFPTFFQAALIKQWKSNAAYYAPILEALDSPFAKSADRELSWKNYDAHLQQQIQESVFDEPFSISQIYIPLNAYYTNRDPKNKDSLTQNEAKRVVVSLEDELIEWIKTPKKDDALRVISGGPGSGKSTFARIFSAKVSNANLANVLFLELHKLDPTKDLPTEIGRYVRDEGFITFDPLAPEESDPNLLIVLDGLDELACQGRTASEIAKAFITEIERTLVRKNAQNVKLRILLSGRELVIQDNENEFRQNKQLLTILPYCLVDEAGNHEEEPYHYHDPKGRLKEDLRERWWSNYGTLIGDSSLQTIPPSLIRGNLSEITAQPLLNYLVALSYTRGKVDFTKEVSLNRVYGDLVEAVHERGYDNHRTHISVKHLNHEEFQRILEEVALAAWHGDGRTTTVREINVHCEASNLRSLLEKFQEGASAGVTRLLAAFFFRQHGERKDTGDRTFVFTHKSFGEYLAACRITRAVYRITEEVKERDRKIEKGWSEIDALIHWARICGASPCTPYIKEFILGELARASKTLLDDCRDVFSRLFSYVLANGTPMEQVFQGPFRTQSIHSRNAEETLLVLVSCIAKTSRIRAKIYRGDIDTTAFGDWFRRIQGQRTGSKSCLAARSLSYLSMPNSTLDILDLYGADMSYSDFSGSRFHYSTLINTNLTGTNFTNSIFYWANLSDAETFAANFSKTKMGHVILSHGFSSRKALSDAKWKEATFDPHTAKIMEKLTGKTQIELGLKTSEHM